MTINTEYRPRQWTPTQRVRQAKRIRQYKPWLKSTGPKTPAGKKKCSQNAYKRGAYGPEARAVDRYLQASRLFLRVLNAKLKQREADRKAAKRLRMQKVVHIVGDAPMLSLPNCPLLEGGRSRTSPATQDAGRSGRGGSIGLPSAESRYALFGFPRLRQGFGVASVHLGRRSFSEGASRGERVGSESPSAHNRVPGTHLQDKTFLALCG